MAELTTMRLVEGRYEDALLLTEEVLQRSHKHSQTWTWARFQRGIAQLALGNLEDAARCMCIALRRMVEEDWSGILRNLLGFVGVLLAMRGQDERAAELLAHGLTHPHAPGRLKIDPLIIRYRDVLQQQLGDEAFAAAWERGVQLDTLEAAKELLESLREIAGEPDLSLMNP